jgi:putative spermidine/putrescine transport system permease protein
VLSRSAGLRTGLLLLPPMLWLGVAYLAALAALFVTSVWGQNDFTGDIERVWTWDNYRQLWDIPVYRTIAFRTVGIAALVTVVDALLAFPIALYMAKMASPRTRRLLVIAVLMPLWASYLVKAYAKKLWYWTTPVSDCLDGRTNVKCTTYADWTQAWTEIKG